MVEIFLKIVLIELGIIFLLFLIEVGLLKLIDWAYMETVTHPNINTIMHLFGDSLYMIGGGVFGSGAYEYMIHKNTEWYALVCGIIMIIAGAYIRHINKK